MKKILISFVLVIGMFPPLSGSTEFYEEFRGGGIGYAPTLVIYDANEFGLPGMNMSYDFSGSRYFHGLQGWGDINDRWRIGASLLAGTAENSEASGGKVRYAVFSQVSVFLFLEGVIPFSYNAQLALNMSAGVSALSAEYFESTPTRDWTLLFVGPLTSTKLTARKIPTLMPQLSFLYQFSRRSGVRINGGLIFMTISTDQWKVNDRVTVSNGFNGELLKVMAPVLQMMIYFGM
ncbi:MAG: hypothetical protein J7K63_03525 [Candidatus Marinimicrobia bacterium]|nr:hypothetical protein [Candidatus Neomarinimicrobiota bacterium]